MAKPKGVPALTAERVWKAVEDGSLVVEKIPGTRVLRVLKARIRYTWSEDGQRKSKRFTIPAGSYLHPRWNLILDEREVHRLESCDRGEFLRRGILQTSQGWQRLIYQQVEDIFHLDRQIGAHILPQYDEEQEELWRLLDQILTQEAGRLRDAIDQRLQTILAIRPHLAGRAEAVSQRLDLIQRRLKHIHRAIEVLLQQPLLTGAIRNRSKEEIVGTILGISRTLTRHHQELVEIRKERPFNRQIGLAQYYLREAIAWLQIGDIFQATAQLKKALPHLVWPKEEKGE